MSVAPSTARTMSKNGGTCRTSTVHHIVAVDTPIIIHDGLLEVTGYWAVPKVAIGKAKEFRSAPAGDALNRVSSAPRRVDTWHR